MQGPILGAARAALAALSAVSAIAIAAPKQHWTIVDVGDLGAPFNSGFAQAINNRGEVGGWSYAGPVVPMHHGFIYRNGTIEDLGVPSGFTQSNVNALNNSGMAVGDTNVNPAVYDHGTWTVLPVQGTLLDVNEGGMAAGSYRFGNATHAMIYKDGSMTDIGALIDGGSVARGINNAGTVVGTATFPSGFTFPQPSRAFVYENGSVRLLDTLGGKTATGADINNAGTVIGTAQDAAGVQHAVIYEGSTPRALGLPGNSIAQAINERGQIVGQSDTNGFLYEDGTITLLESIPEVKAAGWTRLTPMAINDRGWITGVGLNNGRGRPFLLMTQ
jgi:probable HAF family extracellular repeat protein